MFKFQKGFSRLLVLPKPIGKAKRKLVLDDSDEEEEEEQPMSKSAKRAATRAATLEEYFKQAEPSTSAKSTGVNKAPLLPTPDSTLPVYHLRIEDFNVDDIVVKVCKNYVNYSVKSIIVQTGLNWCKLVQC